MKCPFLIFVMLLCVIAFAIATATVNRPSDSSQPDSSQTAERLLKLAQNQMPNPKQKTS
jgi:hypothetical protein